MLKRVLISSCLLYVNLIGFEVDKGDIDSSKQGIILGTFSAKDEAQKIVRKYPQFDTYIKEVKTARVPYYVVFAVNINTQEHNLVFELIKRKSNDAFKISNDLIKELSLNSPAPLSAGLKVSVSTTPEIKKEINPSFDLKTQIEIAKKAIVVGAFNLEEQAQSIKEKFPDDDIYVKKVTGKNGIYFVSYSVNIPKETLSENLKRIKEKFPTAYIASDKRVKELARIYNRSRDIVTQKEDNSLTADIVDNDPKKVTALSINSNLPEKGFYDDLFADDYYLDNKKDIKPEKKAPEIKKNFNSSFDLKTQIDISKKAIVVGAFKSEEQAQSVKGKLPDKIYVKKVTGKNGIYFVSYSVNIAKEKLSENLKRIKEIFPTAYIASDKRVKELARIYNNVEGLTAKKEDSSLLIDRAIDKNPPKASTVSINTNLPEKELYDDLFMDDYYLDKKKEIESKEKTPEIKNHLKSSAELKIQIDISKKAIALGAFILEEQAFSVKEKFPDDKIYIKKVTGKNGIYFVSYSVNIPKETLSENLKRIKTISPSAYIASDQRVKELAQLFNSAGNKKNEKFTFNKDNEKPKPEFKNEKENSLTDIQVEKTAVKEKSFVDLNKRSLTIAKVPSLQEANNIAANLYMYDVLIKSPVIKNAPFGVYLINIEKDKLKKVKDHLLKSYPQIYETSRTRLSYFFRKKREEDIYISKNTSLPLVKGKEKIGFLKKGEEPTGKDEYEEAKSLFREKRYKDALEKFLKLSSQNPEDKNINFYIGRSYYELGDYERSSSYFERITIKDENNLRVKLELAQSYLMLDLYDDAIENFNSVLQGNIPKNVRHNIENRLKQIEQERKKHFVWGKFNLNITHDNNSYNVSDARTFSTLDYADLSISDEKYSEISTTAALNLNHLYKFSNDLGIKNSIDVVKKYYDKDDQRLDDNTATSIAREEKKQLDLISYGFSFIKSSERDMISSGIDLSKTSTGDKEFLKTKGMNLSYQRILYRKIKSMMSIKIYNKSYQQIDDKNMDSNNFQFMFGQILPSDEFGKFNLIYIYDKEKRISPLKNGYDQRTSDKDTNTIYLSNFYELTDSFSLQTGVFYSLSKNKDRDSNFDIFGLKKKDELKTIFTQLQYALNKNMIMTTGIKYYDNDSNIDIYSYEKLVLDFGFIYNF